MTSVLGNFACSLMMRICLAGRRTVLVALAIVSLLPFAAVLNAFGQATETVLASLPGVSNGGLILASDGNFYGTTTSGGANNAGTIYKVSTAGALTVLYSFTGGADGGAPAAIIQGIDGKFYGTTYGGGTVSENGLIKAGTIFSFDPETASLTTLHSFGFDPNGFLPAGALVEGTDGVLYGTTVAGGPMSESYPNQCGVLFSIHTDGSNYTVVLPFPGDGSVAYEPGALLQGADGNFYGASSEGGANLLGSIFQVTPAGNPTVPWSFTGNADGSYARADPLVEGSDGSFYGTTTYSENNNQGGVVYQLPPGKNLTELHSFVDRADGFIVSGGLVWGSDSLLYGTTGYGGGTPCTSTFFNGCGTFFRVKPDGTGFETLYKFGAAPDASVPIGAPIQASDGKFYGVTTAGGASGTGAIYAISSSLASPIQISFSDPLTGKAITSALPNAQVVVTWKVFNAFSETAQSCAAFLQGPSDKIWTGRQSGTLNSSIYTGHVTVTTPGALGSYTYALTCGGNESGFGTLSIGEDFTIVTTTLPTGIVTSPYTKILVATGGIYPYTWSLAGGQLPKGLTLDPKTGTLQGAPLQYGMYSIDFQVTDSSPKPLTATATLELKIISGLSLLPAVPNAVVGKSYSQILTTTGGLPPYTYSLTAGKLPAGITLNASGGALNGTPTQAGTSTFSIEVADSEDSKATVTQAYTIKTAVPPLVITSPVDLPDAAVGVAYSQALTVTGGVAPFTWSLVSGIAGQGLPPGTTLSSLGVITGRPKQFTNRQLQTFTVQVSDAETPAVTVTAVLGIVVQSTLKVMPSLPSPGYLGVPYSGQITATGGLPPYQYALYYMVAEGNPGLTFNSSTGVVDGTLTKTGTFHLTVQAEDSEAESDSESVDMVLVVVPASTPTMTTLTASNNPAGTGMPVTFTASVKNSSGSVVGGTVIFYNGTAVLGTSALDSTSTASFTTSFPANGSYSITAAYSGGSGAAPSTSSPLTETVVTPTITGTVSPTSLTIADGASGTLVITLNPVGGYAGTVTFSCGMLPAHISCNFAPPSLTIAAGSGPVTDTLTINTVAQNSAWLLESRAPRGLILALTLWFPGALCFGSVFRRHKLLEGRSPRLFIVLAILAGSGLLGISGCGGSGSTSTKAGTYTVPITLTASGSIVQLNATVVVQ